MPDQWTKLLTKSAITREDYAKDPQAVLDVLEFYTDHQKRELEEKGMTMGLPSSKYGPSSSSSSLTPSFDSSNAPARYGGTGLAGARVGSDPRPGQGLRQNTTPEGGLSSTALAAQRAAELVNGSSSYNGTVGGAQSQSSLRPTLPQSPASGNNNLQASRPAPPRPLLTAGRPAPPAPPSKSPIDQLPSSDALRSRQKPKGPPGLDASQRTADDEQREARAEQRERDQQQQQRPPLGAPSKSAPATEMGATQPASGAAGATVGPPPVKPLQPTKKLPPAAPPVTITAVVDDEQKPGTVADAAAALEKPKEAKEKERRISTMSEAQIMDKLRTVVSPDDPKLIYSKIKKVGQG